MACRVMWCRVVVPVGSSERARSGPQTAEAEDMKCVMEGEEAFGILERGPCMCPM
jgi:hypothetical protein